jgi:RsiW-degrading membrane proteinase PrsW (M82 family)
MAIRVVCPTCAKNLTAPDAAAGKQASCPACKTKILVPATAAPTATKPAAPKPAAPTAANPASAAATKPLPSTPRPAPKTTSPAPTAAQPKLAPKPTASSPTSAQPTKNPPAPHPQPAQPAARPATAAPVARTTSASSAPAVQPKRVPPPPPPPSSATMPVVRPKAPANVDDHFVDTNDIEIIDEYGISLAPVESPVRQQPRPAARAASIAESGAPDVTPGHGSADARPRPRAPRAATSRAPAGVRRFLYFALVLAIIPLAISIAGGGGDIEQRLQQTFESHPDATDIPIEAGMDASDVLQLVANTTPEHRIVGAHLSTDSWAHWIYACFSAGVFLAVAIFLFEQGTATSKQLLAVGATTATLGIISLLLIQLAASFTSGVWVRGNIVIMIAFYVLKFIAFSYQCASDPENGFLLSFFGYTFGVGLCEELTKAAPVLLRMRSPKGIDWRGACVWGLASGVGFGVAEGIMYSSDSYNGVHTWGIYLVRFISCVALHAVWSAAVGLTLWHERNKLSEDLDWKELIVVILIALAGPMVLHGLYDTMLKRDMAVWALVTAIASFVWLAVLIEWTRYQEENEAPPPKKTLRSIRAHQSPMLPSE